MPAAQLYGDFCAMVSAKSLVQSIEMTGCDHHIALQKHTFRYPTDMSTSVVSRASKATDGRDLALREAEMNRQRVRCFLLAVLFNWFSRVCFEEIFLLQAKARDDTSAKATTAAGKETRKV